LTIGVFSIIRQEVSMTEETRTDDHDAPTWLRAQGVTAQAQHPRKPQARQHVAFAFKLSHGRAPSQLAIKGLSEAICGTITAAITAGTVTKAQADWTAWV
jgi:hypothetical protein